MIIIYFCGQGFVLLVQSYFHSQVNFRSCQICVSITVPHTQSSNKDAIALGIIQQTQN